MVSISLTFPDTNSEFTPEKWWEMEIDQLFVLGWHCFKGQQKMASCGEGNGLAIYYTLKGPEVWNSIWTTCQLQNSTGNKWLK